MTLVGILGGVIGTVLTALIAYLGAKGVQRATARRTDAEADKTAVDGYDLLTGRLEARLTASEARESALLERVERAEAEAARCRQRVEHLERVLAAHGITEENA